jgi:hypothetical protein
MIDVEDDTPEFGAKCAAARLGTPWRDHESRSVDSTEPMTTRDIALEMLVTRALDRNDQKLLALMTKRVGVALPLQRLNAVVRSSSGPGQFVLWEIER